MKAAGPLLTALGSLVRVLPLPVVRGAGTLIGHAAWWLLPGRRRVAQTNVDACFPEFPAPARQRLARRAVTDAGTGFAECLLAWHGRSSQWADAYTIEGLEHLLDAPRPQLVLMAHFTCVELACRIVNEALPDPGTMVVRAQRSARREAWIDAGRRRYAAQTIEKKNLRAMLRVLQDDGRLMYGPDQNFSYRSVFVPFFGVQAATLTATADLAARTGATVVPVWAFREGGRYRVVVDPPWRDFPSGDAREDATRVNAWIEGKVRRAPEQYLWVHRRFRTRPPGEPPFYARAARRRKHR